MNTEMKLGRFAHCKCWNRKVVNAPLARIWFRYPIFPPCLVLFFFSSFFLYLFVLVVSTRERCILETSIDALEKRIASIYHYSDWCTINSAMYAHTATMSGHREGWTAISLIARFYPLCAILSATRDAPDAPRVLDFHRLSFIAAENIENIFVYCAPRTPSKTHSYYNGRRFQVWLAFPSCFIF